MIGLLVGLVSALLPRSEAPPLEGVMVTPNLTFDNPKNFMSHQGYKVILFYPHDFTFVCPTELIAFSNRLKEFQQLNTKLLGVSVDSHFTHLAWMTTPRNNGGIEGLQFSLLSDLNKRNAVNYGVLVPQEDVEGGKALRGLFIIDGNNKVKVSNVNDLAVGRNVDQTIRLIRAFQHVDKSGEGCPAGWQPGSKTIKTDPWGSKEYFQGL